ncbi:MAG TPA: hypothetical protein VM536_00290, partial [Chloroflexia bacterium]|nr:hypothetical protein [Chloroflexia bacterium]
AARRGPLLYYPMTIVPRPARSRPAAKALPAPAGPPAADKGEAQLYSWVLLVGLAAIVAFIDPIILDLRPRFDISLIGVAAGLGLLGLGALRGWPIVRWAGVTGLWAVIAAGIVTQIVPLGVAPGIVWAPRGALLLVAFIGWLLFRELPGWGRQAIFAVAVPTLAILGWMWISVPVILRTASVYWMGVDSRGTLYASDSDAGIVWVFNADDTVRGKLWPRRGLDPRTPGPGIQPAGIRTELTGLVQVTPTPGGPSEREFYPCGLAIAADDSVYLVDPSLRRLLRFDRDAQLRAIWNLPENYQPASGCLALDADHLYVGDGSGQAIYVYDYNGQLQTTWKLDEMPRGLSMMHDGRLAILYTARIEFRQYPAPNPVGDLQLPAASNPLEAPYETMLGLRTGDLLVSNVAAGEVLRYGPDGSRRPAIGTPGRGPGQLSGPAGMAEDRQGRLLVSDFQLRVIQRFTADGRPQAVLQVFQDEVGEIE